MQEILSNEEMAEADRLAISGGETGLALMENAGLAVADRVARYATSARIAVLAGPGNNGGDGFVAGRLLRTRGYQVRVLLVGGCERLRGDAAEAAARWAGPIDVATDARIPASDVIIDAIFGAGLNRPVHGIAAQLIAGANDSGIAVFSVDLPSGVNGTTGEILGCAINAAESITFFRRKTGHVLLPGRLRCGHVSVADIGIPAGVLKQIRPRTFANTPALWGAILPRLRVDGHKYSRGHALVVSGGVDSTGAARLAASAALRAGAGLVTIASPTDALALNATANAAVMVREVAHAQALARLLGDCRINAVAIGPGLGLGPGSRALVLECLGRRGAVVLDADALTNFADDPATLIDRITASPDTDTILTQHDGEFDRLFNNLSVVSTATSKLQRARAAANLCGAVCILKGPDTVVAAPDGRASIADNAPPFLATAGSGDVLAGIATGLLAQGMPAFEAASAAVWLHGEAGKEAGKALIADDLPQALAKVYRRLEI
ncbi:MAG: NAD(P)H-hydrate dehydratase [Proteobacteria bacterium]|nr:NAD(P)H-hydrate dehydratase [Pseudomonadota bacterium]